MSGSHNRAAYFLLVSVCSALTLIMQARGGGHDPQGRTMEFRAIFASYSHPVRDPAASTPNNFWNRDYWAATLTEWGAEGYNAVVWSGPSEFGPAADGADHMLLRLKEFPEARQISEQQNERIINQMKWLFRQAKEHGMKNFLYTHTVWYTLAFAKAHGLDQPMPISETVCKFHNQPYGGRLMPNCCVRNELTRAYTEAVFAEAPQVYQDLDGFYADIGEALPGDRGTWFRDAIAPGLRRSGRKPLMIALQWQVPLEDYEKNIAPKDVYDNTWLGFHAYNSEQITDAKPYPGLVYWAERTGLPTVAAIYPANITQLPFNSPRLAYEIVQEMGQVKNLAGFLTWHFLPPELSSLFNRALAYYAKSGEPYSDAPWLRELEEKYGSREAAGHFLKAYDISSRIIPEFCALVYSGNDVQRRELRVPYTFLNGQMPSSWMTSPVRGGRLVPIPEYAMFAGLHPQRYKDKNGTDPTQPPYFTEVVWGSEGGSIFNVLPAAETAKIRKMGEESFREAELGLTQVKSNRGEAEQCADFMKAYMLLSRYYDIKVSAGVAAGIYSYSGKAEDQKKALELANGAVESYIEAAQFMHEKLDHLGESGFNIRAGQLISNATIGAGISSTVPDVMEDVDRRRNRHRLLQAVRFFKGIRVVNDCCVQEIPHTQFPSPTEEPFDLSDGLFILLRRKFSRLGELLKAN